MAMGQEQRAIHPFFTKGQTDILDISRKNRRKRRRTSKDNIDPSTNEDLTAVQSPPAPEDGPEEGHEEEHQPQQLLSECANPKNDSSDSNNGSERERKVLKLNPNGKLLSSPVVDTPVDNSRKRATRRGKAGTRNVDYREKKMVVIDYSDKERPSEVIGKQIDDILSGQTNHSPGVTATHPPAAAPKQQPAKPTHPFFMKKSAPKPEIPVTPQIQHSVSASNVHGNSWNTDPAYIRPTPKPLSSFKHAFSKVPEPIQPLWPPFGLSHIRDIEETLVSHDDYVSSDMDSKKSKTTAVRINKEDSILSSIIDAPSTTHQVLRIPEKQVASGRVLQEMMAKQLTAHLSNPTTDGLPSIETLHPAVSRLYSSLPTSMAAFDRGEYEPQLWTLKYTPNSAAEVLCATKEALMLRDWLKHLIVSSVETGNASKAGEKLKRKEEKKRKRRKKTDKVDGFVVSSDDEASEMGEISGSDDELAGDVTVSTKRTVIRSGDLTVNLKGGNERGRIANVILISGPSGCGKTASVHAVAKEMDFEVFEINSGSRRSAKDILDRLGDMTQNHLVHNLHSSGNPSTTQTSATELQAGGLEEAKQNKLMGFFKSNPTLAAKEPGRPAVRELDTKRTRTQKQSLILIEEADILFEEDKQFWSGVLTLIHQSKRPIVITCHDENLIPLDDISFHAILRFRPPTQELTVDYLLLMAANEGHVLNRTAVERLYLGNRNDLRKSIMELNFWCQLGVGSEKSGLDWIVDRWPRGIDLDSNGHKLRVLSMDTYRDCMGWFSRDISVNSGLSIEAELQKEALHWWQLGLQGANSMEDSDHLSLAEPRPDASKFERLDSLRNQSEYMEAMSVFDVLAAGCSMDIRNDVIDTSLPPMSEKQKLNYVEGYQLLSADLVPNYTALTLDIGSTFGVLVGKAFREPREVDLETELVTKTLKSSHRSKSIDPAGIELSEALLPVIKPDCLVAPAKARAELAFEHNLRSVTEDIAPYVRSIVSFDLRLEQYRLDLSRLLSGGGRGTKRVRTTRASRAALEGGNKSETRKERWFSPALNVNRVLSTGKRQWQDLLVQNGYFTVPAPGEQPARADTPASSHPPSSTVPCRSSSMSLFGTSPDDSSTADTARRSKSSLFADEPSFGGATANFGGSSLFDDDGLSSPWSNNSGRRTTKQELVKTLLPDSDVPESYIDAYDLVLSAGERAGSGIGLTSVRELLSGGGLTATDQAKILNLVLSGDTGRSNGLGRGEFSVLLALIGLAQEGEDLTFDTVDDRRKKLPSPRSSYLDDLRTKQEPAMAAPSHERPATPPAPPAPPAPVQEPGSVQSRRSGRNSIGSLDADPWGAPQLHRGHAHAQPDQERGTLNGYGSVRSGTNAWVSSKISDGGNPVESPNPPRANGRPETRISNSAEFGWGDSFAPSNEGGIGGPVRAGLSDFGRPGSDHGEPNPGHRSLNIGRATSTQVQEVVTVALLQEKEGMFMFQHRNYEVKSARRGSTVVRRYSDFVWLLDCLHKRYPFRQLPLLPPKRLSVNGTHLAADSTTFLEKRRRGLVRFTNSLVQHPVLSQEQLVVMFLTVPTELSVWRKQATISVQDEFSGRALPPDLEDSLPVTLMDTFDTVRNGVKRSAEVYINLCTLLERLAKRNEGLAADHLRFSLALQSLTEVTRDTYATDTNDVPLLNEGIKATARHLSASQTLLEDEARAWEDGMLEDLKRQRDNLVAVREMFERRDRYARNNIPQLERRIETNERKLQELRGRPQGTIKPGEIEKVEESIFKDKESIVQQHARGVFIKECIRDELTYFQQSQYHISRLHQDWSQERVKYSELQADNWRSLNEQVEGMPLGD
ncbi:hypothetical protein BJX99DRAFT_248545 [Aspergillus californicus]